MILTIDTEKPISHTDAILLRQLLDIEDTAHAEDWLPPLPNVEDEDVTADEHLRRATTMIAEGQKDKVKAALETVGVSRVSEVTAADVSAFMEALDA